MDELAKKEFSRRISAIRASKGLNIADFSRKLDCKRSTIVGWESGKSVSIGILKTLEKEFDVNLDWFLTGKGEMFRSIGDTIEKGNFPTSYQKNDAAIFRKEGKIPLLRQKVSCGQGVSWNDEQNIENYVDISSLLSRRRLTTLYALTAQGSSMLGAGIQDGDILIFDGNRDQEQDGTYVFSLDGEVYCKRLEFDALAKQIKIFSVRSIDLKEAELIKTLNIESPDFAGRFFLFGKVISCTHPTD